MQTYHMLKRVVFVLQLKSGRKHVKAALNQEEQGLPQHPSIRPFQDQVRTKPRGYRFLGLAELCRSRSCWPLPLVVLLSVFGCQVNSIQVFYFPKQLHIYALRYTFKTMSIGMAKQRSTAYRAACPGTKYKLWALIVVETLKSKGRQLDNPVVTGGTSSCHNDNPWCHQWRQSCQIDDRLPPEKQLTGSSM